MWKFDSNLIVNTFNLILGMEFFAPGNSGKELPDAVRALQVSTVQQVHIAWVLTGKAPDPRCPADPLRWRKRDPCTRNISGERAWQSWGSWASGWGAEVRDVFVHRNHFSLRRNSLDLRARRWFKQKNDPGAVILHSEFPCVVNPCESKN